MSEMKSSNSLDSFYLPKLGIFGDMKKLVYHYSNHHLLKYRFKIKDNFKTQSSYGCSKVEDLYVKAIQDYHNIIDDFKVSIPNLEFERGLERIAELTHIKDLMLNGNQLDNDKIINQAVNSKIKHKEHKLKNPNRVSSSSSNNLHKPVKKIVTQQAEIKSGSVAKQDDKSLKGPLTTIADQKPLLTGRDSPIEEDSLKRGKRSIEPVIAYETSEGTIDLEVKMPDVTLHTNPESKERTELFGDSIMSETADKSATHDLLMNPTDISMSEIQELLIEDIATEKVDNDKGSGSILDYVSRLQFLYDIGLHRHDNLRSIEDEEKYPEAINDFILKNALDNFKAHEFGFNDETPDSTSFDFIDNHYQEDIRHNINENLLLIRKKRQLGLITLGSGLFLSSALSAFNIHQTGMIKREIYNLKQTFSTKVTNLNTEFQHLKSNQDSLFQYVTNNAKVILESVQNIDCSVYETSLRVSILAFQTVIESELQSIIEATRGRVTNHFMPHHILKEILKNEIALKGSIYHEDPGLFYTVSTSIFVGNILKDGSYDFIISIPLIFRQNVAPVIEIVNLGYQIDHMNYQINIPSRVMILGNHKRFYTYEDSDCKHVGEMNFCITNSLIYDKRTVCLERLIRENITSDCEIHGVTQHRYQSGIFVSNGLLLSGHGEAELLEINNGNSIVIRTDEIEGSRFYLYEDFQRIKYNHMFYESRNIIGIYTHTINISLNIDIKVPKDVIIPSLTSIKQIEAVITTHQKWESSNSSHSYYVYFISPLVGSFTAILIIMVGLFKYQLHLHNELNGEINSMIDMTEKFQGMFNDVQKQ